MDFMSAPQLRILESFPEPEFTTLRTAAFADFGVSSKLLAEVLADETNRRSQVSRPESHFPQQLRIGAFIDDRLVGWSYSRGEDNQLHMVNSGIFPEFRRRGIYSDLVKATIAYADTHGFLKIISRHVPSNNAVIIPKLRLGFMVSAFEYSEVYGPLVHLTYLIGSKRRELYQTRSMPIVPSIEGE
jgi:ribosomal protein S18 acetylase RimI-like enzyme